MTRDAWFISAGAMSVPKVDAISVDEITLADEFQDQFDSISSTRSLLRPLEVHSRDEQGIGMAMMESLNAQKVGYALQRQFGFKADTIATSVATLPEFMTVSAPNRPTASSTAIVS